MNGELNLTQSVICVAFVTLHTCTLLCLKKNWTKLALSEEFVNG
jgi:hypothetical protein